MSKASKPTGSPASKSETIPFEEAMKRLESIVEAMETEELPLETLLARFEEGTRLVNYCQGRLAEAELRIHQLEKSAGGEPGLKPMALPESDSTED